MDDLFPPATAALIEEAQERLGLTSTYKLAQALNWPANELSSYKKGRSAMGLIRAKYFATVTGIPLERIADAAEIDQARRGKRKPLSTKTAA